MKGIYIYRGDVSLEVIYDILGPNFAYFPKRSALVINTPNWCAAHLSNSIQAAVLITTTVLFGLQMETICLFNHYYGIDAPSRITSNNLYISMKIFKQRRELS